MSKYLTKEMRKRRKVFPWFKAFCSKYSEKFLDDDKSEALNFLLQNIDIEVNNLILENNMEKAPYFFNILNTLFLHFWWQIRWKSSKIWKKYWKRVDVCDVTATNMQKECCVKLLHGLIQTSIFLSNGCTNSDWVDRVLTIIKLVPGSLNISYDALLLLNNLKKKYMQIYCVILKHILFSDVFETVKVPATFIKVILLFRRLLKFTKDEKEKKIVKFLATKLKPPADTISWLSSLNIGCVKKLNVEILTQDFLSRPYPDEFLRKLTEVLKKNEYLCQNTTQVVTTVENEPLHAPSNGIFPYEDLFSKKKKDYLRTEKMELQNQMLIETTSPTFYKNAAEKFFPQTVTMEEKQIKKNKTLKEKQIKKEETLDNFSLSPKEISRKRKKKNIKDKNNLVSKSKKELKNMLNSEETNAELTKLYKKEVKKFKKDCESNYPKHIDTDGKNESEMLLSNLMQSPEISMKNEEQSRNLMLEKDSIKTLSTKVNISDVMEKHKKKRKEKKSKNHAKEKTEENQKIASSVSKISQLDLNKLQTENRSHSDENEILNHIKNSATKKWQSHNKNLLIIGNDKNFIENQSQICSAMLVNNDINSVTDNCLENNSPNFFKQTATSESYLLEENDSKGSNYVEDLKEKSKVQRRKLFNVELNCYNKSQSDLTKILSNSKSFQNSVTIDLNKNSQHENDLQVSKTMNKNEIPNDIDHTTSKLNENEEGLPNLTATKIEKDILSTDFDKTDNSDDTNKSSSCQGSTISSNMSISDLLKITPIKIYRNNKVLNIKDCKQSNYKNKSSRLSTSSSKSEGNSNTSDVVNNLKVNKRRKDNDSGSFCPKPISQSTKKTAENKLLYASKKILQQTYAYKHYSSPSLFDEEISSNSTENIVVSKSESEYKMQSCKQNFETNSNDTIIDNQCDGNSLSSNIQESSTLTLVRESRETQIFDSECEIQQSFLSYETNSNDVPTNMQCNRSSNVRESSISTFVTESSQTIPIINSECNMQVCKQIYETDSSDAVINIQHNEFSLGSNIQHPNTQIVVAESSKIHSDSSIFQYKQTDIVNDAFPHFSEDENRKSQTSDLTNHYVNVNNSLETNTAHINSINLPHVIIKDIVKSCPESPMQEVLSQLTKDCRSYGKSDSIENPILQFPIGTNVNQNEIQNIIFENSCEMQSQISRNESNIFSSANYHEKEAFLQNEKNTSNSIPTNNFRTSFADCTHYPPNTTNSTIVQTINDNFLNFKESSLTEKEINQNDSSYRNSIDEICHCIQNTPKNTFTKNKNSRVMCKDPSTCIIDCKIINNHNTNNNLGIPGISSVQVIINLNNENNESTVNNSKIIANFDFQSETKSSASLSNDSNPLHHISLNDNLSSCRNVPCHEIPFVGVINSNESSPNNVCQLSKNSNFPNCGIPNVDRANNCHSDTIPTTSNFLSNEVLETNSSQDVETQASLISDDENLRDVSLNNVNLNNSLSLESSIYEELNIINAKSNDHPPNNQKLNNKENPTKRLKPLNSENVASWNKRTKLSPSIISSNHDSSYRTTTEIYSDLSDNNTSISTLTDISDDEFNSCELQSESSDDENRCLSPSKSAKQIMTLPSFESAFQRRIVKQSTPENLERSMIGNNGIKAVCNEHSASYTDISKPVCTKDSNSSKSKRKVVNKKSSYSEFKNHRYNLRSRKALQTPEKFHDFELK